MLRIIPILQYIEFVEEPWVKCHIMVPSEYLRSHHESWGWKNGEHALKQRLWTLNDSFSHTASH